MNSLLNALNKLISLTILRICNYTSLTSLPNKLDNFVLLTIFDM
uniref:Uncharacterized protein n=1 Tax=Physcomitrium patens TaxID=3218 RepID=A0A7I3YXB0_PHYPA